MASKKKNVAVASGINFVLLQAIANGTVTRLTQDEGLPLVNHNPPLIEVNTADVDGDGKAAVRLTAAGNQMVADGAPTAGGSNASEASQPKFQIITNATPPESKRRGGEGGGAPTLYPFEDLAIGGSFFVPVSEKYPDPVKKVGSAVSSANMRYRTETGETVSKTRAKRGKDHKVAMDETGNRIMETVTLPKYKQDRKFIIRPIEAGKKYGEWTADQNGALITRVEPK